MHLASVRDGTGEGGRTQRLVSRIPPFVVRFRVVEMFQDTERLLLAGAKGFCAQQFPVLPMGDRASARSCVPSEVGVLQKSVQSLLCSWQVEAAQTAFILVLPSFSERSIFFFYFNALGI